MISVSDFASGIAVLNISSPFKTLPVGMQYLIYYTNFILVSGIAVLNISYSFQTLPVGLQYAADEGKKPSNKCRNRYRNMFPCKIYCYA